MLEMSGVPLASVLMMEESPQRLMYGKVLPFHPLHIINLQSLGQREVGL